MVERAGTWVTMTFRVTREDDKPVDVEDLKIYLDEEFDGSDNFVEDSESGEQVMHTFSDLRVEAV